MGTARLRASKESRKAILTGIHSHLRNDCSSTEGRDVTKSPRKRIEEKAADQTLSPSSCWQPAGCPSSTGGEVHVGTAKHACVAHRGRRPRRSPTDSARQSLRDSQEDRRDPPLCKGTYVRQTGCERLSPFTSLLDIVGVVLHVLRVTMGEGWNFQRPTRENVSGME
jgi:hypothetical protein